MINWKEEQRIAINKTDSDLIVTASAGSGKTTTMVARALELIKKGVPALRLLLLTYSEAAALEMKEKLRNALIEYAKGATENIDFIRAQIDDLAIADISTIHSYCKRIVKNYFEVAGVSPGFAIADGETSKVLISKALKNLFDAENKKKNNEGFFTLRNMLSPRNDEVLTKIICVIYEHMSTQADRDNWLENSYSMEYIVDIENTYAAKYIVDRLKQDALPLYNRCVALNKLAIEEDDDIYIHNAVHLTECVSGYINNISLKDCYIEKDRERIKWKRLMGKAKESILYQITDALRKEVRAFEAFAKELLGGYDYEQAKSIIKGCAPQVAEIIRLVKLFDKEYSKLKKDDNLLDFSDLEKYALVVLANEEKRDEIVKEHDYVFVDEYQDTNYVQERIINLITPPESLFVVGDSKQCIYRFRLAEPQIFLDRLKDYKALNKAISFNDNFRSCPEILHFVNDVFSEIMSEEFGGVNYREDAAFNIPKEYHKVSSYPAVQICAIVNEDSEDEENQEREVKSNGVYSVLESQKYCVRKKGIAEGRFIADQITNLVNKEYIRDKDEVRLVDYDDITIMFRQRSHANGIIAELIRCKIPLKLGLFALNEQSEDVASIINYIKLLNNSLDDYVLIAALHSRMGNFTNSELAEIRKREREGYFYEAAEKVSKTDSELGNKLSKFYSELKRYRFEAEFMSVNNLAAKIIEENGYSQYLLSMQGGADRLAVLKYFLASLEGKSYCRSLAAFCDYFTEHEEDIEWGGGNISTDKGVNICTIHASKGLEYPIVILAGAANMVYGSKTGAISVDKDLGIGTNFYDEETRTIKSSIVINAITAKKKYQEKEEEARLLYVALTRAKSHLIVTGEVSAKKIDNRPELSSVNNNMDWLLAVSKKSKRVDDLINVYYITPEEQGEQAKKGVYLGAADEELKQSIINELNYVYPYQTSLNIGIKYTATGINNEEDIVIPSLFSEERIQRGVDYHKIMQYIDYGCKDIFDIEKELERLYCESLITQEEKENIDKYDILRCLSTPLMQYAATAKCLREQRFMYSVKAAEVLDTDSHEMVLVQGTIDLLVLGEENIIVDFKYSGIPDNQLRDKYRKQLEIYKNAVESSMNIKINKAYIYSFKRGKVIEI